MTQKRLRGSFILTGFQFVHIHIYMLLLSLFCVFFLYRSKKATAATRCMCPLYDLNRQAWIELQPMTTARLGHGVVAAGQYRLCLGITEVEKKQKTHAKSGLL